MTNKYHVFVRLEGDYTVFADDEDEAFEIASQICMDDGDWEWDVDLIEDGTDDERNKNLSV